ncbi:MAG TPA: hypothetical protein PLN52_01720, partial [Opitutaceae bacterium]|nr:hypothetical protein [Opitutaceae bacterium]
RPRVVRYWIMGYIILIALGGIIAAVLLGYFFRGTGAGATQGRLRGRQPVQVEGPAADEPTPARTSMHSPSEVEAAEKKIPPA